MVAGLEEGVGVGVVVRRGVGKVMKLGRIELIVGIESGRHGATCGSHLRSTLGACGLRFSAGLCSLLHPHGRERFESSGRAARFVETVI